MISLDKILNGLMTRYQKRVPDVEKILNAMVVHKLIVNPTAIENDHIAFRTMGVEHLGIASLEKIFLHHGYTAQNVYHFEQKKVRAKWYAPPHQRYPRIFISELLVDDLPLETQKTIRSYTDEVETDPVDSLNLDAAVQVDDFLHSALWRTPTLNDYKKLAEISEYAAWVIYNRYYLNHYTISVHQLPEGFNTLEAFNAFLVSEGILLSNAGGLVKKSKDGLLLQSSTVSQLCEATFAHGEKTHIPGSYVEFAERKVLPEFAHLPKDEIKRKHRREGFETANADKIFESTFTSQVSRR